MAKKHHKKKYYHKITSPSPVATPETPQIATANEILTQTSVPKVAINTDSSLSHSPILVFAELKRIALIFAILILILVGVVYLNNHSDVLQRFNQAFCDFLHINR